MSLYKNTNEMFNNSSLYHSDTYLGNDYTDGIKHYKYLYKEVKNGHTYYVYNDSEQRKARAAANKQWNKYKDKEYVDKEGWHHNKDGSRDKMYINGESVYKRTKKDAKIEKDYNKGKRMRQEYFKQSIKDVPKRIHAKGIAAVSRMIKFFRGDYS